MYPRAVYNKSTGSLKLLPCVCFFQLNMSFLFVLLIQGYYSIDF